MAIWTACGFCTPLWDSAYDGGTANDGAEFYLCADASDARLLSVDLLLKITIPEIPDSADAVWAALRYGWVMGAPVTPVMEAAFSAQRTATRATLLCFHVASRRRQVGRADEQGAWLNVGEDTKEQQAALLSLGKETHEQQAASVSLQGDGTNEQQVAWPNMGEDVNVPRPNLGEGTCEQRAAWDAMGRVPNEVVLKIILGANFEIRETLHCPFLSKCGVSVPVHNQPSSWRIVGEVVL